MTDGNGAAATGRGDALPVIDADGHVMEPDGMWAEYIDPAYRDRAPRRVQGDGMAWGQLVVDGVPIYRNYPDELVAAFQHNIDRDYGRYAASGFDARSQLVAMDDQGIDEAWLYPSLALGVLAIDGQDPDLAAAVSRAYNRWLADFCSEDPSRLHPVATVSLHSPDTVDAELAWVAGEMGARAVTVRPNPVGGRHLGHPDLERFWAACEDLDLAVGVHEGCHTRLPAAGSDRFTSHFAMHTCCHPMEQMMAFVALVEGGVLERHPGLRVAFLEAGCGWLPYLLWRMDEEFELWGFQVPQVKRPPSEYFTRQCFAGVEGDEPGLDRAIETVGADRLLFASDYPHPDHGLGQALDELREADIDDAARTQILSVSPRRFYGRVPVGAAP